jgi:hypothetical protein
MQKRSLRPNAVHECVSRCSNGKRFHHTALLTSSLRVAELPNAFRGKHCKTSRRRGASLADARRHILNICSCRRRFFHEVSVRNSVRQVFWLSDHPDTASSHGLRQRMTVFTVTACSISPRLQRRDRDGFLTGSVTVFPFHSHPQHMNVSALPAST